MTKKNSDYNPQNWQLKETSRLYGTWRINEDLLDKQEVVDQRKKEIKEYFEINLNSETKLTTVWDAFKAVIRGSLINFNYRKGEKETKKMEQRQKKIR